MFRVTALVVCLVCAAGVGTVPLAETAVAAPESPSEDPQIVSVYPNPVTHGDAGEYVAVWLPPGWGPLILTDGRTRVKLPGNLSGRVVVSDDAEAPHIDGLREQTREEGRPSDTRENGRPTVAREDRGPTVARENGRPTAARGDTPASARGDREPHVVTAPDLTLANGGGRLRLREPEGQVHDTVAYDDAPEGERWITATAAWRPLGYDPREPRQYENASATLFTLPDAPSIPQSTLRGADERILLAGYTLTATDVVETLLAAHDRGVRVRILLERSPVGGMSRRQATALDRLAAAGVDVRLLGGARSRFGYHHAKYAVVDEQALVLTENWKPAGTGGNGSRGWGVRTTDSELAAGLATLFVRDADGVDATAWSQFRQGRTFAESKAATGEYPREIAPKSVRVDRLRLLTAPGNAEREMVAEIDDASDRVLVVQSSIERESALVEAAIRAASRGVEVRILLSDAWYVVEDNRERVAALNEYADRRGLSLSARVDEPRGQYEKIHAKGLVVDEEAAYVGSLNWNSQAADRNREVVLELRGATAAGYFASAFQTDWKRGNDRLPIGLAVAAIAAAAVAAAVARRRISFGDGTPVAVAGEQRSHAEEHDP